MYTTSKRMFKKGISVLSTFVLAFMLVPADALSAMAQEVSSQSTQPIVVDETQQIVSQSTNAETASQVKATSASTAVAPQSQNVQTTAVGVFAEANPNEGLSAIPGYYKVAAKSDNPGQVYTLYYYTVDGSTYYRVYGTVDGSSIGYYVYDEATGTVDTSARLDQSAEEAAATVAPDGNGAEQAIAGEAAAPATALAAQSEGSPVITPQATSTQFTSLKVYTKAPDQGGTVVADLLAGSTNIDWKVLQEYYLVGDVANGVDDSGSIMDSWVSVAIPYWMRPVNMIGGNNWNVTGASVDNTYFDKIVSFTDALGGSSLFKMGAGTQVLHVKTTQASSHFEVSMYPSEAYYDGTQSGQVVSDSKLICSCGLMNGSAQGAATQAIDAGQITKTPNDSMYFEAQSGAYADAAINDEVPTQLRVHIYSDGADSYACLTNLEFDLTYPTGMNLTSVLNPDGNAPAITLGAATDNGNGTSTVHCTESNTTTGFDIAWLNTKESFPSSFAEGTYSLTVSNAKAKVWGSNDETSVPGSTMKVTIKSKVALSLGGVNQGIYDWLGQQSVKNNTRIACWNFVADGPASLSSDPVTLEETYPSNSLIRAISVPKGTNAGSTITINGTNYDVASVAHVTGADYYVIRNTDLGLSEDTPITSVKYDMGALPGGFRTTSVYGQGYTGYDTCKLAGWGSFANGTAVTSNAVIYKTGTSVSDPSAANASSVAAPETTVITQNNTQWNTSLSVDKIVAGGSTTVTAQYSPTNWATKYYYGNTVYAKNPTFFLHCPKGFSYADFTIGGVAVAPKSSTTESDGSAVYTFECPTDQWGGIYDTAMNEGSIPVQYTVTTKTSANPGTYNLSDFLWVGSDNYPYKDSGNTIADTYNINGGRALSPVSSKTFTIQELKMLTVDNEMQTYSDSTKGTVVYPWMTYNSGDPNGTRAFIGLDNVADYKVTLTNQTGADVANYRCFVPVPKDQQNYGAAFEDQKQEFSLYFQANMIDDGLSVQYIKLTGAHTTWGATTDLINNMVEGTDYTVLPDSQWADADFVVIKGVTNLADGESRAVTFTVTANQPLTDTDWGKIDLWKCVPVYTYSTGGTAAPMGYPEAVEVAGGHVDGYVYADANGNGVQDEGEAGIGGATVQATDTYNGRVVTTATDDNGHYAFTALRNQTTGGYLNDNTTQTISVLNPDASIYTGWSPITATGSHPSGVTAAADNASASKVGVSCKALNGVQVNAGLTTTYTVTYKDGGNGTINGATAEVTEGVQAGKNPANVPATVGDTGYRFKDWTADKDVTLADGTTITAGTGMTDAQVKTIAVASDLTLTANFKPDVYTLTFDANGHDIDPASQTLAPGAHATEPAALTAAGYTFHGWATTATATESDVDFSTWTMPAADTTLHGVWTLNSHAIHFDMNGGTDPSSIADISVDYGTKITSDSDWAISGGKMPAPKRAASGNTYYTFAGWRVQSTGAPLTADDTMPDADVTLVAQWAEHDTPVPPSNTIGADNFRYQTGASSPVVTDDIARTLSRANGTNDGIAVAASDIAVDAAQLAAINAARAAGLTGDYPLTFTNNATGETIAVTATLYGDPAFTVTKTASVSEAKVGDKVTYTVTVKNTSEVQANGYFVSDTLPDGLEFVSSDPTATSVNGSIYLWKSDFAPGAQKDITITAKATQAGDIVNTAYAYAPSAANPDQPDTTTPLAQGGATVSVAAAPTSDLDVVKIVDKSQVAGGDTLTYNITLTNNGASEYANIPVRDYVPDNTSFLSCDSTGTYGVTTDGREYVDWTVPSLAPGESKTLTMTVTVNECQTGTGISNTALWGEGYTKTSTTAVSTVGGTSIASYLPKTGDAAPVVPLGIVALAALAIIAFARRRSRED